MAAIPTTCSDCSAACSLAIGQSFALGELVWSESFQCPACGSAIESDGHGFPPPEFRDAIIASDGLWGLNVDLTGSKRLSACKILHCDLNTDFSDVPAMKHRIPGVVYVGTRTEMCWLQSRLSEFGFAATVGKVDRDSIPSGTDLPIKRN